MIESIRMALGKTVKEVLPDCAVYGEEMPQKGKRPAVSIHLSALRYEKKIGRSRCTAEWKLCAYPKQQQNREELLNMTMKLLREPELMTVGAGKVRLQNKQVTMEQERLVFTCETPYDEKTEETSEVMRHEHITLEEEWK